MLANQHVVMYSDEETSDVLAITYILDKTDEYKKELLRNDLQEKKKSLQKQNQQLNTEKRIMDTLCQDYVTFFCLDFDQEEVNVLKKDTMVSINTMPYTNMTSFEKYEENMKICYEEYVDQLENPDFLEKVNLKFIKDKLQDKPNLTYRFSTIPYQGIKHYVEIVISRFDNDGKLAAVMGCRLIDDVVAEEKERNRILSLAFQGAKDASIAKSNFLSRMSHDIRTPLNGIIGLLRINEDHFDDYDLVKENHKKMKISAQHLLSLINDVLQMSKIEEGSVELSHEVIEFSSMCKEIYTIMEERNIESGISFEFLNKEHYYPSVYGSPIHIKQIFLNIYSNCIKYNHFGGKITTSIHVIQNDEKHCTYKWIIKDNGIGMSNEFLQHIFEPFVQENDDARSLYKGTGLGMSIVKGLIDQMGGTIQIASERGVGSTFIITIPFEIANEIKEDSSFQEIQEYELNGLHLLLVEDNELNAEVAKYLLEDRGMIITSARNGKEAVEIYNDDPANTYDAILMDIMMPIMDGLTASKTIRQLDKSDSKTIPIIAMTANAFKEDRDKCLEAGMNEHISKPLDIDKVQEILYKQVKMQGRR